MLMGWTLGWPLSVCGPGILFKYIYIYIFELVNMYATFYNLY